ncbi:MAG TPA: Smr/MutS family protein [Vicinamibacteria bacterium]|nr:Smr/MutS family protein [Vicinamibacteria bacterium]
MTEPAGVRDALARTSEAVALLRAVGRQPYHDLPDPAEALAGARVRGTHLDPRTLADLASFVEGGVEVCRRVARVEETPRLARLASEVQDTGEVAVAIRRALLPSGEVADDASPRLADLRRTLLRLKSQLTSLMEGYLRSRDAERLLQDRIITTRNDRYVLLLKAENKGQLPGIIHGTSGSGASFFVEPLPAVELNNDIVQLQDEERNEVLRILQELTESAGRRADDLAFMSSVLGELDAVQAMALLAVEMDAHPAEIVEGAGPDLDLIDSRHPLLMPKLAERLGIVRSSEPVPVSLRVGGDEPVLVISGPNTGGKTVALKTVGLFALMSQCGLHVPAAAGSRLPVFRKIYADIGDEQSIAENLSTFSSHLAAIVEMTRDLEHPALVLLDEVGAGTDPTEGGALGVAIVEHFRRKGATVVATTHHGLMKAYAQSTTGVATASFGYHPETYEPTFRLTLGAPGRSLALEMAERLGLPAEVVADARGRRDDKEQQAEALLARLEKERAELERDRVRIEATKAEAEGAKARALAAEHEIQAKKRREVEVFAKELKRRADEVERKAADAIHAAVAKVEAAHKAAAAAPRLRTEAVRAIREARDEVLEDPELDLPEEQEAPAQELEVGMRVRVRPMRVAGELLALQGDLAEVAVSGKRLRLPRAELVALAGRTRPGDSPRSGRASIPGDSTRYAGGSSRLSSSWGGSAPPSPPVPAKSVPAEVNLIGLTVDEARERVDKLLDDAALSDRREIRLIHGFGAGKLRKAVAQMLEGHPLVSSWRLGGPSEGGGGATVVELKD